MINRFGKEMNFDKLAEGRDVEKQLRALDTMAHNILPRLPCPICSHDNDILGVVQYSRFYRCSHCGHGFTEDFEDDGTMYNSEEYMRYMEGIWDGDRFTWRVEEINTPKLKFVLECAPETKDMKWLDIGCGAGETLIALDRMNIKAKGVDINREAVRSCRMGRGLDVQLKDVTKGKISKCDVAVLFGVLEHMKDPRTLISKVDAQYMVIEVPRMRSLSAITCLEIATPRHLVPFLHRHLFSNTSMEIMMTEHGYEPLGCWQYGQDYITWLRAMLRDGRISRELFEILGTNRIVNNVQAALDEDELGDTALWVWRRMSD